MSAWLHRTTLRYLPSTSESKLPEPVNDYVRDPDLSAVIGQPKKYWIINGDTVRMGDANEQSAVDTAEAAASLLAARAEAVTRASLDIGDREMIEVLLFEINKLWVRVEELQVALLAAKASTGGTANLRDALPANYLDFQPKLRSQLLQEYVNGINEGNSDP